MTTPFTLTPAPTSGTNAFGFIPGNVTNPIGNAPALNDAAGGDILSKLGGTLSPGTMAALQNAQATFGQTSGMPGSGLSWNSLYGNIAGASEAQQQQGLTDYNTITGPQFQTGLAEQNAVNAAAPDPTQAASYAEKLFNNYLAQMRGGGGGSVNGLPGNLLSPGGFGGGSAAAPSFGANPGSPSQPSMPSASYDPFGLGFDPGSGQAYSPFETPGGYDTNSGENWSSFDQPNVFGNDPSYNDIFAGL